MEGAPVFLKSSLSQAGAAPLSLSQHSPAGLRAAWGSPTGGGSCLAWPRPGLSVPRVSRAELAVPWVAQRCPPCVPNVSCARGLCCPCTLQGGCCWWPQGLGWLWALWPWWGTSSTFPACPPVLAAPQQV